MGHGQIKNGRDCIDFAITSFSTGRNTKTSLAYMMDAREWRRGKSVLKNLVNFFPSILYCKSFPTLFKNTSYFAFCITSMNFMGENNSFDLTIWWATTLLPRSSLSICVHVVSYIFGGVYAFLSLENHGVAF